jgi:hypothetical protein
MLQNKNNQPTNQTNSKVVNRKFIKTIKTLRADLEMEASLAAKPMALPTL